MSDKHKHKKFCENFEDFKESSVPQNSLYTFDDNNDRLLVKKNGQLFRYSELDHMIYDVGSFEPTIDIPLETKSIVPSSKERQVLYPNDGYFGIDKVIVQPIPYYLADVRDTTVEPGDVLEGKVYIDADGNPQTGTLKSESAVNEILDTKKTSVEIVPGVYGDTGHVRVQVQRTPVVTPTLETQTIIADDNYVIGRVVVNPIPVTRELNEANGYTVTIG